MHFTDWNWVSKIAYYFIFDNHLSILENSGPIGLMLTFVISEVFLQCLENKAMQKTLTTNLVPLPYKRYFDDSHTRFEKIQQYHSFVNTLSK